MQVGERSQIGELHVLKEGRADGTRIVDDRGDGMAARDFGRRLPGCLGIREIHLDVSHLQGGGMKIEGNYVVARGQETLGDRPADAGAAAGDERSVHRKSWIEGRAASQFRMSTRFRRMRSLPSKQASVCQAVAA